MNRDDYVVGHVRDALAHDGETDVQAAVVAGRLVLTGNVVTQSRRVHVTELASAAANGMEVVNELSVLDETVPSTPEELT